MLTSMISVNHKNWQSILQSALECIILALTKKKNYIVTCCKDLSHPIVLVLKLKFNRRCFLPNFAHISPPIIKLEIERYFTKGYSHYLRSTAALIDYLMTTFPNNHYFISIAACSELCVAKTDILSLFVRVLYVQRATGVF